jgi:hypothetical protein
VERPNVYDNGAENGQAKRNEPTNQEKQATDDLEPADDVNVAAGEERVQIFTGHTLGKRRHRKEMEQPIGAKENEDQSEKNAGNNSENFHDGDGKVI